MQDAAYTIASLAGELHVSTVEVARIVLRQFDEAGEDFMRAPYPYAPPSLGTVEGPNGPVAEMYLRDWAVDQIKAEIV